MCTWIDIGANYPWATWYLSNNRQAAGLDESTYSTIYISFLYVQKLAPY